MGVNTKNLFNLRSPIYPVYPENYVFFTREWTGCNYNINPSVIGHYERAVGPCAQTLAVVQKESAVGLPSGNVTEHWHHQPTAGLRGPTVDRDVRPANPGIETWLTAMITQSRAQRRWRPRPVETRYVPVKSSRTTNREFRLGPKA